MMMEALGNLSSERNSISLNQNKMFVKNQFPEVNKLGDFGGGLGKRNRGADLGLGKEVIDEEPQEGVISFEVDFIEKYESEIEQSSRIPLAEAEWSSVGPAPGSHIRPSVEVGPNATVVQADWDRDAEARRRLEHELEHTRTEAHRLRQDLQNQQTEAHLAQTEIRSLQGRLRDAEHELTQRPSLRAQPEEALTMRAQQLEHALTQRDEEVARLERQLAEQLEVRHILGSEIEDSGARFARLTRSVSGTAKKHSPELGSCARQRRRAEPAYPRCGEAAQSGDEKDTPHLPTSSVQLTTKHVQQ